MNEPYYIDGVDVSKCKNFRQYIKLDYMSATKDTCIEKSAYPCKGKPCGFKCIAYGKAYKKLANILKIQKKRNN